MIKYLLNPLPNDVQSTYNLDGDVHTYTLPAEKVTSYDYPHESAYEHVKQDLVTAILNHRNLWHFDHEREKVREEITKEF